MERYYLRDNFLVIKSESMTTDIKMKFNQAHVNDGNQLYVVNTLKSRIPTYIAFLELHGLCFGIDYEFGSRNDFQDLSGTLIIRDWLRVEQKSGLLWAIRIS